MVKGYREYLGDNFAGNSNETKDSFSGVAAQHISPATRDSIRVLSIVNLVAQFPEHPGFCRNLFHFSNIFYFSRYPSTTYRRAAEIPRRERAKPGGIRLRLVHPSAARTK
jgi:hypothetical protein